MTYKVLVEEHIQAILASSDQLSALENALASVVGEDVEGSKATPSVLWYYMDSAKEKYEPAVASRMFEAGRGMMKRIVARDPELLQQFIDRNDLKTLATICRSQPEDRNNWINGPELARLIERGGAQLAGDFLHWLRTPDGRAGNRARPLRKSQESIRAFMLALAEQGYSKDALLLAKDYASAPGAEKLAFLECFIKGLAKIEDSSERADLLQEAVKAVNWTAGQQDNLENAQLMLLVLNDAMVLDRALQLGLNAAGDGTIKGSTDWWMIDRAVREPGFRDIAKEAGHAQAVKWCHARMGFLPMSTFHGVLSTNDADFVRVVFDASDAWLTIDDEGERHVLLDMIDNASSAATKAAVKEARRTWAARNTQDVVHTRRPRQSRKGL